MGIMHTSFKTLFPKGHPWMFPIYFKALIEALSVSLENLKVFLYGVIGESNPGTATDTLEEWYSMLGIKYDSSKTTAALRLKARQIYSSIGGQSKDYLEEQIQVAYPDVEIVEYLVTPENMIGVGMVGQIQVTTYPSWIAVPPTDGSYPVHYYRVKGEVDDISDLNSLKNLLARIAPLTHEAVFEVTILNQTATAEAGLAMAGLAQVGRTKEDA